MNPEFSYPTAFRSWGPEEYAAIERIIASDRFTMGAEVEAFEAELAEYHNRKYAVCCNSGSSANLLAVSALRRFAYEQQRVFMPEDWDVVIPAIAWSTTYSPFMMLGLAQFKVLDVDETWNADWTKVRAKANKFHAVTCPVLGNTDGLIWPIPILEDGCESSGARDANNRLVGSPGPLISTGSGYISHQISCIEMGWALTDDYRLAELIRLFRNHGNSGWGNAEWEKKYDFQIAGMNLRPLELHAAIGRIQLGKLSEGNVWRRYNQEYFQYHIEINHLPITMQKMVGIPAPFGIAFEIQDQKLRNPLIKALAASGIDSRLPTGGCFTLQPYGAAWRENNPTPNADRIHYCGMFLGNAPFYMSAMLERTIKVIKKFFEERDLND